MGRGVAAVDTAHHTRAGDRDLGAAQLARVGGAGRGGVGAHIVEGLAVLLAAASERGCVEQVGAPGACHADIGRLWLFSKWGWILAERKLSP